MMESCRLVHPLAGRNGIAVKVQGRGIGESDAKVFVKNNDRHRRIGCDGFELGSFRLKGIQVALLVGKGFREPESRALSVR